MTVCPLCEQDYVRSYVIENNGERLQLCEECDSTWPPGEMPTFESATGLDVIMRARGFADIDAWDLRRVE